MHKAFLKIISLTTVAMFLANGLSFAELAQIAPVSTGISQAIIPSSNLQVPAELGTIDAAFQLKTGSPQIIYIQDAHAVRDAQIHIQKLIEYFSANQTIDLVALEGTEGKMDPALLRTFPDERIKKKVLAGYLNRGELTGAEMSAIFGRKEIDFYGIENQDLYLKNYKAYFAASQNRPRILENLKQIRFDLDSERKNIYSKGLNEFHEQTAKFHGKNTAIIEMARYFHQFEIPEKYSHLKHFVELCDALSNNQKSGVDSLLREAVLNFKKKHASKLSKEHSIKFNQAFQAFSTGSADAFAMLAVTHEIAGEAGFDPELPAELLEIAGMIHQLKAVRGAGLFSELNQFTEETENSLIKTNEERSLVQSYRRLNLIEALASLELTREEWKKVVGAGAPSPDWLLPASRQTDTAPIFDFPSPSRSRARGEGVRVNLLEPAIEFYRIAARRDEALFENLKDLAKSRKVKSVLVIGGGFHASGLAEEAKAAGFSCLIVSPKINSLAGSELYAGLMQGKTSYAQIPEKSLYESFITDAVKRLTAELNPQEAGIKLKFWRDEMIRDLARKGNIVRANQYTRFIGRSDEKTRESLLAAISREIDAFKRESLARLQNLTPQPSVLIHPQAHPLMPEAIYPRPRDFIYHAAGMLVRVDERLTDDPSAPTISRTLFTGAEGLKRPIDIIHDDDAGKQVKSKSFEKEKGDVQPAAGRSLGREVNHHALLGEFGRIDEIRFAEKTRGLKWDGGQLEALRLGINPARVAPGLRFKGRNADPKDWMRFHRENNRNTDEGAAAMFRNGTTRIEDRYREYFIGKGEDGWDFRWYVMHQILHDIFLTSLTQDERQEFLSIVLKVREKLKRRNQELGLRLGDTRYFHANHHVQVFTFGLNYSVSEYALDSPGEFVNLSEIFARLGQHHLGFTYKKDSDYPYDPENDFFPYFDSLGLSAADEDLSLLNKTLFGEIPGKVEAANPSVSIGKSLGGPPTRRTKRHQGPDAGRAPPELSDIIRGFIDFDNLVESLSVEHLKNPEVFQDVESRLENEKRLFDKIKDASNDLGSALPVFLEEAEDLLFNEKQVDVAMISVPLVGTSAIGKEFKIDGFTDSFKAEINRALVTATHPAANFEDPDHPQSAYLGGRIVLKNVTSPWLSGNLNQVIRQVKKTIKEQYAQQAGDRRADFEEKIDKLQFFASQVQVHLKPEQAVEITSFRIEDVERALKAIEADKFKDKSKNPSAAKTVKERNEIFTAIDEFQAAQRLHYSHAAKYWIEHPDLEGARANASHFLELLLEDAVKKLNERLEFIEKINNPALKQTISAEMRKRNAKMDVLDNSSVKNIKKVLDEGAQGALLAHLFQDFYLGRQKTIPLFDYHSGRLPRLIKNLKTIQSEYEDENTLYSAVQKEFKWLKADSDNPEISSTAVKVRLEIFKRKYRAYRRGTSELRKGSNEVLLEAYRDPRLREIHKLFWIDEVVKADSRGLLDEWKKHLEAHEQKYLADLITPGIFLFKRPVGDEVGFVVRDGDRYRAAFAEMNKGNAFFTANPPDGRDTVNHEILLGYLDAAVKYQGSDVPKDERLGSLGFLENLNRIIDGVVSKYAPDPFPVTDKLEVDGNTERIVVYQIGDLYYGRSRSGKVYVRISPTDGWLPTDESIPDSARPITTKLTVSRTVKSEHFVPLAGDVVRNSFFELDRANAEQKKDTVLIHQVVTTDELKAKAAGAKANSLGSTLDVKAIEEAQIWRAGSELRLINIYGRPFKSEFIPESAAAHDDVPYQIDREASRIRFYVSGISTEEQFLAIWWPAFKEWYYGTLNRLEKRWPKITPFIDSKEPHLSIAAMPQFPLDESDIRELEKAVSALGKDPESLELEEALGERDSFLNATHEYGLRLEILKDIYRFKTVRPQESVYWLGTSYFLEMLKEGKIAVKSDIGRDHNHVEEGLFVSSSPEDAASRRLATREDKGYVKLFRPELYKETRSAWDESGERHSFYVPQIKNPADLSPLTLANQGALGVVIGIKKSAVGNTPTDKEGCLVGISELPLSAIAEVNFHSEREYEIFEQVAKEHGVSIPAGVQVWIGENGSRTPVSGRSLGSAKPENYRDLSWLSREMRQFERDVTRLPVEKLEELIQKIVSLQDRLVQYWPKPRPEQITKFLETLDALKSQAQSRIKKSKIPLSEEWKPEPLDLAVARRALEEYAKKRALISKEEVRTFFGNVRAMHNLMTELVGRTRLADSEPYQQAFTKLAPLEKHVSSADSILHADLLKLRSAIVDYIDAVLRVKDLHLRELEANEMMLTFVRHLGALTEDSDHIFLHMGKNIVFVTFRSVDNQRNYLIIGLLDPEGKLLTAADVPASFRDAANNRRMKNFNSFRDILIDLESGGRLLLIPAEISGDEISTVMVKTLSKRELLRVNNHFSANSLGSGDLEHAGKIVKAGRFLKNELNGRVYEILLRYARKQAISEEDKALIQSAFNKAGLKEISPESIEVLTLISHFEPRVKREETAPQPAPKPEPKPEAEPSPAPAEVQAPAVPVASENAKKVLSDGINQVLKEVKGTLKPGNTASRQEQKKETPSDSPNDDGEFFDGWVDASSLGRDEKGKNGSRRFFILPRQNEPNPERLELSASDYKDLYRGIIGLFHRQRRAATQRPDGSWENFFRIVEQGDTVEYGVLTGEKSSVRQFYGKVPAKVSKKADLIFIQNVMRANRPGRVGRENPRVPDTDPSVTRFLPENVRKMGHQFRLKWDGPSGNSWWAMFNPFSIWPPRQGASVKTQPHHLVLSRADGNVSQTDIIKRENLDDIFTFWRDLNDSKSVQDEGRFKLAVNGWYYSPQPDAPKGGASQLQAHAHLVRFDFPIEHAQFEERLKVGNVIISELTDGWGSAISLESKAHEYQELIDVIQNVLGWIISREHSFNILAAPSEDGNAMRVFIADRVKSGPSNFETEWGFAEFARAVVVDNPVRYYEMTDEMIEEFSGLSGNEKVDWIWSKRRWGKLNQVQGSLRDDVIAGLNEITAPPEEFRAVFEHLKAVYAAAQGASLGKTSAADELSKGLSRLKLEFESMETAEEITGSIQSPDFANRVERHLAGVPSSISVDRLVTQLKNIASEALSVKPAYADEQIPADILDRLTPEARTLLKERKLLAEVYRQKYGRDLNLDIVLDASFLPRTNDIRFERSEAFLNSLVESGSDVAVPYAVGTADEKVARALLPSVQKVGYGSGDKTLSQKKFRSSIANPVVILPTGTQFGFAPKSDWKNRGVSADPVLTAPSLFDVDEFVALIEIVLQTEPLRNQLRDDGSAFPVVTKEVLLSVIDFVNELAESNIARQAIARAA